MAFKLFQLRSLKTRVTFFTLAIFLIGIWSLAFYSSRMLREDMQRLLGEQQFSTVSLVAAWVGQELGDRRDALDRVAQSISPAMLKDAPAVQALLARLPVFQDRFNGGVIVYRRDGTAIAEVPLSARRIGVNYMNIDTIAAALQEGRTTIGRPVIGKKLAAPVFGMTVPIRAENGEVVGAVAGVSNLGLPNFLDKITGSRYGHTGGYLLIASHHRLIVTATDKRRIMQPLPARGSNAAIDRFADGYEGSAVLRSPVGEEVLASAKGIPLASWYAAAQLPTKEAFAPIRDMQQRTLLAAIALTLVAGLLTWWMLRRQLSPLLAAATALAAQSDGNQPPRALPIVINDEIGQLIHGFNRMLEALQLRELALRTSEARFRALFEQAAVGVAQIDTASRRCVMANQCFCDIVGYARDEMLRVDVDTLTHPDDLAADLAGLRRLACGKIVEFSSEKRYRRKDHAIVWVRVTVSAMAAGRPGPDFNIAVVEDITERKNAEAAIIGLNLRLQALLDAAEEVAIIATDANGNITVFNRGAERMLGYAAQEMLGKTLLHFHDGAEVGRRAAALASLLGHPVAGFDTVVALTGEGGSQIGNWTYVRSDGTRIHVSLATSAVRDEQGQLIGFLGIARDITDQLAAEADLMQLNAQLDSRVRDRTRALEASAAQLQQVLDNLRQTQDKLVQSEKLAALGSLVAGIAHELNTPLGNCLVVSSTLHDATVRFTQEVAAGHVRRSQMEGYLATSLGGAQLLQRGLQRAVELVTHFKQVAVDQGSSQRRPFVLGEVIDGVVTLMHPGLRKTAYVLELCIEDGLRMDSYPGPIEQIISNMINNSVLHAFDGRPHGSMRLAASAEGDSIRLTFSDDGRGMSDEVRRHVFDPFFTTRMGSGGSGLGMSICYNLVTGPLGGSIEVASLPGQGCVFTLVLPRVAPHGGAAGALSSA